jgi:hypothetical protein
MAGKKRRTIAEWVAEFGIELDPVSDLVDVDAPDRLAHLTSPHLRLLTASLQASSTEIAPEALVRLTDRDSTVDAATRKLDEAWRYKLDDLAIASFATEVGTWLASGKVADVDGRLVISELHLTPNPVDRTQARAIRSLIPASGITSDTLRAVRPGALLQQVRREIVNRPKWLRARKGLAPSQAPTDDQERRAREMAAAARPTRATTSGRALPDDFYRQVAFAYLDEQTKGRGIYNRMARRYRSRPIETIRTWVLEAERRGYLTKGTRGRVDRRPGPHLYDVTDITKLKGVR